MRGYPEGFQNAATGPIGEVRDTYDNACGSGLSNPSCQAFLTNQIDNYVTGQLERKDRAIENVVLQTANAFDAHINAASALARNQDLLDTKGFVNAYNENLKNSVNYDNDLTKRQFEINEYHYHNKLDTLFFLQLFFITVLVMAILIYFNRRGTITNQMMGILVGGLAIVLIVVGITRYFYTLRTRDRRLWHRRYFQSEKEPGPDFIQTCPGPTTAPVINLNALFNKDQIQCASDTIDAVKKWNASAEAEAEKQQSGTALPASLFSGSNYTTPESCKRR